MAGKGQRLAVVCLAIAIAVISFYLLTQGLTALGAIGFALWIVVVAVGTRPSRESGTRNTTSYPIGGPRPASAPPDGHIRFTVVVDGPAPSRVAEIWSDLCRPDRETSEEFRQLFRDFTILEGNRFRFRRGDPKATAALLTDVLSAASGMAVRTWVEPAAERTPIWS